MISLAPSRQFLMFGSALLLAAATACGNSAVGPGGGNDAGNDAGNQDAGNSDAGTQDAGNEDAGSDAGSDAGTDAGMDAGSDGGSDAGGPVILTDGGPITATANTWTWVDFADSACSDGSSTGIGVNLSSDNSTNVLIYFEGGGACWNYSTCYQLQTATNGPYTESNFTSESADFGGTILDRTLAGNPMADWNYVFVPYCTGDVHAGSNVITYTSGANSGTYHHVGRYNIEAYLARLTTTFPNPGKVVDSGSSAGGFGALINFDLIAKSWPNAAAYMIDDSGPALESSDIPTAIRSAWFSSWNLGAVTDPLCSTCRTDLSQVYPTLSADYPNARMSLLSSEQDEVIRTYFDLSATQFQTDLLQTATDRIDPTTNIREFFVSGDTHTMLLDPQDFTSNSVGVMQFVTYQVTDSASWAAEKP